MMINQRDYTISQPDLILPAAPCRIIILFAARLASCLIWEWDENGMRIQKGILIDKA